MSSRERRLTTFYPLTQALVSFPNVSQISQEKIRHIPSSSRDILVIDMHYPTHSML